MDKKKFLEALDKVEKSAEKMEKIGEIAGVILGIIIVIFVVIKINDGTAERKIHEAAHNIVNSETSMYVQETIPVHVAEAYTPVTQEVVDDGSLRVSEHEFDGLDGKSFGECLSSNSAFSDIVWTSGENASVNKTDDTYYLVSCWFTWANSERYLISFYLNKDMSSATIYYFGSVSVNSNDEYVHTQLWPYKEDKIHNGAKTYTNIDDMFSFIKTGINPYYVPETTAETEAATEAEFIDWYTARNIAVDCSMYLINNCSYMSDYENAVDEARAAGKEGIVLSLEHFITFLNESNNVTSFECVLETYDEGPGVRVYPTEAGYEINAKVIFSGMNLDGSTSYTLADAYIGIDDNKEPQTAYYYVIENY